MIRRPRSSTLFPTRRSSDLVRLEQAQRHGEIARPLGEPFPPLLVALHLLDHREHRPRELEHDARRDVRRSEEHTSELQSQSNLVCRLLLAKKKIATSTIVP